MAGWWLWAGRRRGTRLGELALGAGGSLGFVSRLVLGGEKVALTVFVHREGNGSIGFMNKTGS